jgi:hypothetical protein
MSELAHYPLPAIFVVSVALIVAAGELGHWLARRTTDQGGESVATLKAAILGLLALMIGFTFAMAQTRFELRRDSVLNEANSIGTTALRARLLAPPHNTESLALLRDYVNVRLEITRRIPSPSQLRAAIERSNAILEALWQQAKLAATKNNAMVPTGLFIQALNQMVDSQSKRLAAERSRVPNIVLLALYATAAVAIGYASYGRALEGRHWRPAVYVAGLLTAGVILLIQDLDRPGVGFINVSQQPMIDLAESLASNSD